MALEERRHREQIMLTRHWHDVGDGRFDDENWDTQNSSAKPKLSVARAQNVLQPQNTNIFFPQSRTLIATPTSPS